MNNAVYDRLLQTAKARQVITYYDLGKVADLDISHLPDLGKLVAQLEEIADHEIEAGRPLLVAVVIRADLGMPAKGLFKYAKAKGVQPRKMDDVSFFAQELARVYDAWKPAAG